MLTAPHQQVSELWQLKKEVEEVGLESIEVGHHLDNLAVTQHALEDEIAKYTKLVSSQQAQISANVLSVGQNQNAIVNYNQKISDNVAATGVRLSLYLQRIVLMIFHCVLSFFLPFMCLILPV